MPKKNFKLTIQYLGTSYNGWQYQPTQPTVQGEIEAAFEKILHKNKQKISLIGSGRTDSGVHALGQVANIKLDTNMSAIDLKNAINSNTSKDIFIKDSVEVDLDFNSRFSAKRRVYIHKINRHIVQIQILHRFCFYFYEFNASTSIKSFIYNFPRLQFF